MFPSTFRVPKSVCVSSVEGGPRSWDWGLGEDCEEIGDVENCLRRGEELGERLER